MATEMNFWTRIQTESPRFFVKVQNICIAAGTASTGIFLSLKALPNFIMPSWAETGYGYVMVASIVAGVLAKTPIKDGVASKEDVTPNKP